MGSFDMFKMIIITFMLYLRAGILTGISIIQSETLKTFVPGGTVTLSCVFGEYHENYFLWFMQSLGKAPTCIATLYAGSEPAFYGDFKHDRRFKVNKSETLFTLTITDLRQADTGIYYCAARDYDLVVFSNGVFLKYEGENLKHHHYINGLVLLDKADNNLNLKETVHPGDSVTLQCTVLTRSCAGEHSVYWFRHGSGESHPGIIYTHEDSSGQCKKSSEVGSLTHTCVFNLPKRNLSLSDAGTYHCAVAMCGEILFGNGSKLEFADPSQESEPIQMNVIALVASNVLCIIIIAALLLTKMKTRHIAIKEHISGEPEQSHAPTASSISAVNETVEGEELNYAAIHFPVRKFKKQETPRHSNAIYSSVSGLN